MCPSINKKKKLTIPPYIFGDIFRLINIGISCCGPFYLQQEPEQDNSSEIRMT
jgi:hypothetical protein